MKRCAGILPTIWETNERRGSHRGEGERFDPQVVHDFVDALCRFVLRLEPDEARQFLDPVFAAAPRFSEQAASMVTWLILHQGDRVPALTLWHLWQRFADDFAVNADAEKVDEEDSDDAKMLRELFLGVDWAEQRDWLPLHGETQRIRSFFMRLPPTERGFECYAYYLAKAGTPTLPDALIEVSAKLVEASSPALLNETAIFYFEEILTRLIYGGNCRIRNEVALRHAALGILDALVDSGSSPSYKLRDDFLTPPPK